MLRRSFAPLALVALTATLAAACEVASTSTEPPADDKGGDPISPQPQPNRGAAKFTAPCNASTCGQAPGNLEAPKCAPEERDVCSWSEDTSVSYRQCAESECGTAPGSEVCAPGTTFKGNTCGSEDERPCAWTTACMPPPSTTPCPTAEGCGPQPAIGVVCKDGSNGELVCMQFETACNWQRSCE